jgi:lipoprotein-anchoring transpeptidase ErfK/SrfK
VAGAVAVVALAIGLAALLLGGGEDEGPPNARRAADGARVPPATAVPDAPVAARLLRRTQLRASPGGRVIKTVGRRTEYRSPRVLAVVKRRGDWLGVLTEHVANSRTAWVPISSAKLVHEPYGLDVDLSKRRLLVRREGRIVRRVRIAIGRPDAKTPTGRFAVTDALRIGGGSTAYGCCALALTGRQPNVPQGWTGGDRIAIHGTSNEASIGTPASSGCMRASNADMRWMLKRITLGAHVRIRA